MKNIIIQYANAIIDYLLLYCDDEDFANQIISAIANGEPLEVE